MFGRVLKIDLTTGKIQKNKIPSKWVSDFIGGSGLAARLLWDEIDPARDPLDPRNPFLWVTGPLTGTGGPATGRFSLCGRSPQTGLWGESNIGGFIGPELRRAGYDILWITGRSPQPAYLWIHNDAVEICPAGHLWGQADTYETQILIREEVSEPRARVAAIGMAGENVVPFANVMADHGRAAGRTGMGALMGSKNLKAVAIRGNNEIPLVKAEEFKQLSKAANKTLLEQNMTSMFNSLGTSGAVDYLQIIGDMPQKYWTAPTFDGAPQISGSEMASTVLTGTRACHGCVIGCGREIHVKEGAYKTAPKSKGPAYETICAFGSQLLVNNLPMIIKLGDICDRFGMDTISAGNTIALAYLLFDRGLMSVADTGGLALHWGDAQPCFTLLEQIARREGFGSLLAQGSRALATQYGDPDLAVQVNGLDVPMHDPRAFSGQALVYVTSPRGACHNQSDFFNVELGGTLDEIGITMTDRWQDSGKADHVMRHQHWRTVCNSLVVCFFAVVSPSELATLLNAASGTDWSVPIMLKSGERAWNLKRAINCHLGLTRNTERLPKLLLQPLTEGGQEGHIPDMDVLLREYYAASGWDEATGQPKPEKLNSLGLGFVLPFS
ncbi:MAG TPA: aldehyde ferredoxin oxidoreductase family protein [Anaerolineae bacterium]|nr:aldehyde ferredoxin oxidoreductase family protein [Anaerolineae bacterium]